MLDYYSILGLFVICYLMECFTVAPGHPLLITRIFLHWRVFRSPGLQLGNGKRLILLNPFPALAEWHLVQQAVCTPTDKGVLACASLHEGKRIISSAQEIEADELAACHDNLRESGLLDFVVANEKQHGEENATSSQQFAGDAKPIIPEQAWRDWTDPASLLEKRNAIRVHLIILQIACTLQFLLFMAALPFFFVIYYPSELGMLCYAASIYALGAVIAATFARAWRKIIPSGAGAAGKIATMLLYPPASMRAIQKLSPILHGNRHESAIALALMGKKDGYAYITHVLACLKYRLFARSLTKENSEALERANDNLARAITHHWSLETAPLLHSSEHVEKEARCFCPVCGISLATTPEFCPHCLEVRLQKVSSRQTSESNTAG